MSAVVVGVDGSAGATRALVWAAREAQLRGVPLRVVYAYPAPLLDHLFTSAAYGQYEESLQSAKQDAHRLLETTLAELGDETDLPIRTEAASGRASPVLIDRSAGADLLVVGSRGRGAHTLRRCLARRQPSWSASRGQPTAAVQRCVSCTLTA